ncbi:MAG: hypothetical protein WCA16_12415, partial [Candidatus Sulfotelmatobacter sp.]
PGGFADSYNGINLGQPQPTVYSQAERGGDFSADAVLPASGNPIPFAMYGDSASPCPFSGGVQCQPGGATPLTYADLFSTGKIPSQDLNALSLKLLNQYVPLPTPGASNNEFLFNPLEVASRNQYIYRIDEKLTNKDALWFYGLNENDTTNDDLAFVGSNLPGFGSANPQKFYAYTVAWNHTVSATTLNEARFGFLRLNYQAVAPLGTQNPSAYGFTGINATQAPAFQQLPVVSVTGLFSLGFSADGPQPRVQNTYQVVDNFSKVMGHHTLKFGFTMDRSEINNPFYSNLNGTYQFGAAGVFSTGNAGADFLLGVPDQFQQNSGGIIRARGREYYSYGQDQWQVRPNLTLTLGLAWDIDTPYKNLYANGEVLSTFRSGQQSTVFPSAPVGLLFPGDKGVNQYGGVNVSYHDFAPRFGFAWSPGNSHNWSVRGGIGLYYNRSESEATLQTLGNAPFSLASTGAGAQGTSSNFADPYNSVNTANVTVGTRTFPTVNGTNPFPFTPPAVGTSPSFAPFEPIGFNEVIYDPGLVSPRATNYNLNVQYQVSKSTVATIGYVGSIGRHLEGAYNLNPAGQAPGVNPTALGLGCTSDFFLGLCTGGAGFQYNPNVYGQIGVFGTHWSSNYNSLQASINRHFSNGLQFQAAYTWSRYFDYTSSLEENAFNQPGINVLNNGQNYGPSANDAPQRLVVNYTYTLPFYKFGHHWRRLTDDWNLSGIATFQHGFPVAVFANGFNDLQWSFPDAFFLPPSFADRTGASLDINHNPRSSATQQWFNPAAFTAPANGVIGTANRNPVYGPGLNYWDTALEKSIHLTESMYFQLRLETFNTFNHANFAAPVGVVGNPSLGQVQGVQPISTLGAGRVVQLGGKFYF